MRRHCRGQRRWRHFLKIMPLERHKGNPMRIGAWTDTDLTLAKRHTLVLVSQLRCCRHGSCRGWEQVDAMRVDRQLPLCAQSLTGQLVLK